MRLVMTDRNCTFGAKELPPRCGPAPNARALAIRRGAQVGRRLLALLLCLLPATAGAEASEAELSCEEQAQLEPLLVGAIRRAAAHPADGLAIDGLAALGEQALWSWLGADLSTRGLHRGEPATAPGLAALLLKLLRSGLFAGVELESSAGALRLSLTEQPLISSAAVVGLRDAAPDELLARFLGDRDAPRASAPREPASALGFLVQRRRMDGGGGRSGCPFAPAEPAWFARVEGGGFQPGLLRGGLAVARLRAAIWLRARGYPHSSVNASLSKDGSLLVTADEGHLAAFEVRGVAPSLRAEVERTLGFHPGDLFASHELRRAAARLTARYPFITLDIEHHPPAATPPPLPGAYSGVLEAGDLHVDLSYSTGDTLTAPGQRAPGLASDAIDEPAPGRVVLWLRTGRATVDLQPEQLLRHTPATGFAPGLAATLHLWDLEDRARLSLDGALAVNTRRSARNLPAGADFAEALSAQEGFDWLAGARVAVPAWNLAELGGQLYALTDTNDGWRMSDLNSYVHSALAATPDRDYFRRAGATLLATFHLGDRLTLGTELHRDRFDPLPSPRVWSLLNSGNAPPPAAPVTAGSFDSVLLRAEWSTDDAPLAAVGSLFRHAEIPLTAHASTGTGPAFSTLATLELGGYAKLLSDSRLQLEPAAGLLVRLRLRAAAGSGLPLQKQEALGGWSALRGYDFKELRGDASGLASLEARWSVLGGFFDLGSVHALEGWVAPRPGTGLQLFLDRLGSLEVAWRLLALALASGCYRGAARPTTAAQLTKERGWLTLSGVPEIAQRGEHDCGAAAAAMLLGYWGMPTGQGAIRAASAAPAEDALTAGFLRAYLRDRGLQMFLIQGTLPDLERELAAGRPVLVGVLKPYSNKTYAHYLVVVGVNHAAQELAVIDPADGWRGYSFAGFTQEWTGAQSLALVGGPAAK